MPNWGQVEVTNRVIHNGEEHIVRVIKRKGLKLRVVLEPDQPGVVAKVAIQVKVADKVKVPEGAETPDRAGNLVEEVLGGQRIAEVTSDGETVCPAMDVTLIASHLRIMHGVELRGLPASDEYALLRVHEELHAAPFHEPAHEHTHEGVSA